MYHGDLVGVPTAYEDLIVGPDGLDMHTIRVRTVCPRSHLAPLRLTFMSHIVGFTFGSFGDILSILQLARTVQRLLSDSLGASSEYQDLLLELDRTLRVLHLVQGVTTPRHGSGSLSINTHEDIRQSISRCRIVIFDLYVRIQKFRESLRKGGSGSRMRDSWRKIGWGLFKLDELVDIRRKLKDEGDVIMALLDVSNSYVVYLSPRYGVRLLHGFNYDAYSMAISRVEDTVRESQTTVLEIKHCIAEIPEVLGHYWEGGSTARDRPIILNDMLGQRILLPVHLCRTSRVCLDIIIFEFFLIVLHRTSNVSYASIIKAKPAIDSLYLGNMTYHLNLAGTLCLRVTGWFGRELSLI